MLLFHEAQRLPYWRYVQATEVLEKALQIDGTNANAWSSLGQSYMMMDNLQKAHLAYQRALQQVPRSHDPQLWHAPSPPP